MQTFLPPLPVSDELYYISLYRAGDKKAHDILIERNLRLVAHIVKKYATPEREQEDLISIGTIGLIKAIHTFDHTKGHKLGTYASRCIENEILMFLRQEKKSSKELSLYESIGSDQEGNEIRLLDILENEKEDFLNQYIADQDIHCICQGLDKCLSQREKLIIIHRYGLFGVQPLTQKEIALQLNISRSYISRIEKRALEKLRNYLENAPI